MSTQIALNPEEDGLLLDHPDLPTKPVQKES